MKVFRQLKLLLWKNYTLQKRRPIATLFQLGLPILFILILLLIRVFNVKQEPVGATVWKSFAPSNLPFHHPGGGVWKLAFAPNSTQNLKLMNMVTGYLKQKPARPFTSEKEMVSALLNDQEKKGTGAGMYLGGIVFIDTKDDGLTYKVRMPAALRNSKQNKTSRFASFQAGSGTWHTKSVFPLTFDGIGPRSNKSKSGGPPDYYKEGFLAIQFAVDHAFTILKSKQNKSMHNLSSFNIEMQRFPYPAYLRDPFVIAIQNSLPLLIMLSLVYNQLVTVKGIVYEKENKLKESMKIMGLSGYLHWIAWFIKCFLFLLIPMAIITIMLTVEFGGNGKMLNKSDPLLVFIYLLLYSMSSIMYAFMISTFFSRANVAAAGGGITWFLSYIPYFFLAMYYDLLNTPQKTISCIDFNVAMAFGAALIGKFEGQGTGAQWNNLFKGVTVDDSFTLGSVLLMMVVDCVFYGLVTWYVEAVFPGEFGIPQPWYFPFLKSYWCSSKTKTEETYDYQQFVDTTAENETEGQISSAYFEKDPLNLKAGIRIKDLKKEFDSDSGVKVAVNNITLNMYEGQITALLGHNGAGKTTTISMLTGLFPPTSGTAYVNDYDIIENITGVRESLGICPQHNVLYDNLTVEEHLWFFAQLKGVTDSDLVQSEVKRLIGAVGLEDKRKILTKNLSGGMKRKLSVGIALIGDSKIVILDEPTSGMDPAARRFTWDLLQKERSGRTILLTTHFMDEADLLGDRIAIMANGVVQCSGSSLFLKNKYGVGYHMVMVKSEHCNVDSITTIVKQYVEGACLENDVGLELSYVLPREESSKFESLFSYLEKHKHDLGISSYGASVTTLEEVFLKVKEDEDSDSEPLSKKLYRQLSSKSRPVNGAANGNLEDDNMGNPPTAPLSVLEGSVSNMRSLHRNTGRKLFFQKWRAMFIKRLLHSKRYKRALVTQLLMPGFWTLMAMVVAKTFPQPTDSPSRTMNTEMFKKNFVPYSDPNSYSSIESQFVDTYLKLFVNSDTRPINVTESFNGNMTSYILQTSAKDIGQFNTENLIALNVKKAAADKWNITTWFNNAAYHSTSVSLNALNNAIYKYITQSSGSITTINHPLPRTTSQSVDDLSKNGVGFNVSFNILFGMAFLASSFVVFLVQEKASKAKHLQFVSGISPVGYWTSAFAWDMINFLIPIALIVIIFAAFNIPAYSGERLGYVILLLLMYGWAIIPSIYLSSFLFTVPSTAFIRLTIFNVITGLATLLTVFILSIPSLDLLDVADTLKWVFLFLPNYALGQAFNDMFTNHQYLDLFNKAVEMCLQIKLPIKDKRGYCEKIVRQLLKDSPNKIVYQENYLAWDNPGIGRFLIFLAWEGLFFFLLVLFIEYDGFSRIFNSAKKFRIFQMTNGFSAPVDDDVAAEKRRIEAQSINNDVLVLNGVRKYYEERGTRCLLCGQCCGDSCIGMGYLAVDGISLGVPRGECFGLLGLNGAGKTTTFKMITGDETVSEGSVFVNGYNIRTDMTKVRQCIGYCPQFDALIDLLTGRELLTMYARLRGIPENHIPKTVESLAVNLSFDRHIDKISKTYSGGNKRKLSTALALVGDPQVVFLDEPTTGMDPAARRLLWNALTKYRQKEGSIVITSHSMEECEALCTRLAVMVNGQFKCLGSPQHLKSRFGEGYTLLARIGGADHNTTDLKRFIDQSFPGSLLKDEHEGFINYQLKGNQSSWARVFGILETAKEKYNIEDYSVSQTTLEQVFLNFAKYQKEDERQAPN